MKSKSTKMPMKSKSNGFTYDCGGTPWNYDKRNPNWIPRPAMKAMKDMKKKVFKTMKAMKAMKKKVFKPMKAMKAMKR